MSATVKLNTNVINVFPSTRRSDIQPSARYQTESTYTEIIRRVCDYIDPNTTDILGIGKEGTFIITKPTEVDGILEFDKTAPFEFCIYGYHFYIKNLSYILDAVLTKGDTSVLAFKDSTDIYAYIDIESYKLGGVEIRDKTELMGRDETELESDSKFYTGIKFTDTLPTLTSGGRYCIHLFSRTAAEVTAEKDWKYCVYKNSLYKISNITYQPDIDGGVITG